MTLGRKLEHPPIINEFEPSAKGESALEPVRFRTCRRLARSEHRLVWVENTGDPRTGWKMHTIKQPWCNAVTVTVAELNKDGRLDIAASAERGANELRWRRNEGPAKKK